MAVVYRCVGILTVDVVVFFRSPVVFDSQDSFLWEISSGVVAIGAFAAGASQLNLQHFRRFTNVTTHSPTLPLHHLTSQLILQPFRCFTYVTTHSPTLPSLYLRHSSFYNLSVTSPKWQLILQPFRRFIYVTAHSPTLSLLHLRHSSFSNPSFASPTSQALHLIHLASCPWCM